MSFFKFFRDRLNGFENKTSRDKTCERTKEGSVYINSTDMIVRHQALYDFNNFKIYIGSISFAYICVNEKMSCPYLLVFTDKEYSIPVDADGFSEMYAVLSKKLGFDDAVFFSTIEQKYTLKKQLFRRIKKGNYCLADGSYKDYALGFEIQSPEKTFVEWNATKEDLKGNPYLSMKFSVLTFKYPVRIGNVVLNNLKATIEPLRKGMPLALCFYSECFDATNTSKSYKELKQQLIKDFAPEGQQLNYERDDQNSFTFLAKGIEIGLTYSFDSEYGYDRGCTFFRVSNNRDFSELFIGNSLEGKIEISDYLLLNKVGIVGDYKKDKTIMLRPPNLLPELKDNSLVWFDQKNKQIGFADANYYILFRKSEIKHFSYVNRLPTKFAGYAELYVHFRAWKDCKLILNGECHIFEEIGKQISEFTGLDLIHGNDFYNI